MRRSQPRRTFKLRTLEKCRKHSPAARVFYISLVLSNARHVLLQCNTRLRLLYLLNIYVCIYICVCVCVCVCVLLFFFRVCDSPASCFISTGATSELQQISAETEGRSKRKCNEDQIGTAYWSLLQIAC